MTGIVANTVETLVGAPVLFSETVYNTIETLVGAPVLFSETVYNTIATLVGAPVLFSETASLDSRRDWVNLRQGKD